MLHHPATCAHERKSFNLNANFSIAVESIVGGNGLVIVDYYTVVFIIHFLMSYVFCFNFKTLINTHMMCQKNNAIASK